MFTGLVFDDPVVLERKVAISGDATQEYDPPPSPSVPNSSGSASVKDPSCRAEEREETALENVFCNTKVDVSRFRQFILLTNDERVLYVSNHCKQATYDASDLFLVTPLAFQVFAAVTLWIAGSDVVKCSQLCPAGLRTQIRDRFLKLMPNTMITLASFACLIGILRHHDTDAKVMAFAHEVERDVPEIWRRESDRDTYVVCVGSSIFKCLEEKLKKNVVIKYDGIPVHDVQNAFSVAEATARQIRGETRIHACMLEQTFISSSHMGILPSDKQAEPLQILSQS